MAKGDIFEVVVGGELHTTGDTGCNVSFCGDGVYPKPCNCGGLIHCEFIDEDWDGCITRKECDTCGYEEE